MTCNALQVRTVLVEKKVGEVVNRLNKTRQLKKPDLRGERERRDAEERREMRRMEEEEVGGHVMFRSNHVMVM